MSQTTTLPPADDRADERIARIRAAYEKNRSQMTVLLARELDVPEVEVVRALPDGLSVELDISGGRWEQLIRAFEPLGNVHVIATNGAVTLECFGAFGHFSTWKSYFNVQTKSLDMHIRYDELATAFAVRKPGHMDGVEAISFQFFDHTGSAAFKVFLTFGGKPASPERMKQFTDIRDAFKKA